MSLNLSRAATCSQSPIIARFAAVMGTDTLLVYPVREVSGSVIEAMDNDMAMPELDRDKSKEDMIFERLDEWIWSLEHDKPPTMDGVKPKLAMESLARIYGSSRAGLPTIEFSGKYEKDLRRILALQGKIDECSEEIKRYQKEVEAHSVRIAEVMRDHEHGVLETTTDKILIDFVTKTTRRTDTAKLKKDYPSVYEDVLKPSESRKLKVSSVAL